MELFKQKKDAIERELKIEEDKLISQMEYARYEHETEMLRERNSPLDKLQRETTLLNVSFYRITAA